jgi:hypothetical protein
MATRPVYSTQFMCEGGITGTKFFTCPLDAVAIVRDIDAHEEVGGIGNTMLAFSPSGGVFWGAVRHTTQADELWQWRGRQVLVGGETVEFQSVSGIWAVWMSGYLLQAP